MKPLNEKLKQDPALKSLLAQSWALILGLFWLARFWSLKSEALWLIKLNTYQGTETEYLVKVSLARDGMMFLWGSLLMLLIFFIKTSEYFINKKKQSNQSIEAIATTPVD